MNCQLINFAHKQNLKQMLFKAIKKFVMSLERYTPTTKKNY